MIPTPHPFSSRATSGRVALAAFAFVAAWASVPAAQAATTSSAPVQVPVSGAQRWTTTGIEVKAGESISVTASGLIHFGTGPIARVAPPGPPPETCTTIKRQQPGAQPFPAPGLPCWSLIGKIGDAPPFEIGAGKTFLAPSDGELSLGVNDNRLVDNSGAWSATIVVSTETAPAKSSDKGLPIPAILGGLLALAILIGLFVVLSRRRGRKRRRGSTDQPPTDEPVIRRRVPDPPLVVPGDLLTEAIAPAAVTAAVVASPDAPQEQTVAPLAGEFVDVNIFEVELSNGTDLRVGYNYFPEGTDLHWQVRQGSAFAHGQFATSGGGSLYHFVMLPLGVHLEPDPGSVDVEFTWTVGGVPFRYSVRRDPGY